MADERRGVFYGPAESRFTQTPISIGPPPDTINRESVTGVYNRPWTGTGPQQPTIQIYQPAQAAGQPAQPASWEDINRAIHHEDIHAAIGGNRGTLYPPLVNPGTGDRSSVMAAWEQSNRIGDPLRELPAYMGAYKPGDLQGVTPEMASAWISKYADQLKPEMKEKLMRIASSGQSIQAPSPHPPPPPAPVGSFYWLEQLSGLKLSQEAK